MGHLHFADVGRLTAMHVLPRSFESLVAEIKRADPVIVHGQVTASVDLEMRVLGLTCTGEDS
jgi:hypothetical protein